MAPPVELIDDVATEIFLRIPPHEPEHLIRASLACKRWFHLLTGPDFRRRYLAFHQTPPLLGYLQRRRVIEGEPEARLFPTTAAPLAPNPYFRRALDCHHGRVLLHSDDDGWHLVVWDPVTGDRKLVPEPDIEWLIYTAVVFCAVSGCDHLDCHGGPFKVFFVATDELDRVKARVYSSETGAWSTPVTLGNDCEIFVQHKQDALNSGYYGWYYTPYVQPRRGAIIGDEIYVTIREAHAIVKYDMAKDCLSMTNPPSQDEYGIALMEMEEGTLGFVYMQGSNLYLWSRRLNSEGAAEWVQCRVIEMGKAIPVVNPDDRAFVVGAAEGVGVIFVSTDAGLFTFNLDSWQVKKIGEPGVYFSILPYMSFYTPDFSKLVARKTNDSLISDDPLN